MANYKLEKEIAVIRDAGASRIMLNLISWGGQPAKYDLRAWRNTFPEGWLPDRGLVLDEGEAVILYKALKKATEQQKQARKAEQAEERAQEAEEAVLIE